MFQNKQFSQPNQTQVKHAVHDNMVTAPWTGPGVQQVNHQTPHNGYHQVPQPHVEANGRPVHPGVSPQQHAFANQVNVMPGTEFQNGNTVMAPIPHAAGPNHAQTHTRAHHHFQNNNTYMQSFQPMNPEYEVQQPPLNSSVQPTNPGYGVQQSPLNSSVQPMNPGYGVQQSPLNNNIQPMNPGYGMQQQALNSNIQPMNPEYEVQQPPLNSSVQPMNPGYGVQPPAPNGNGPVSNNNHGNGSGSSPNRQMSGTHRNEAFNVPSQNGQSNTMMAHQNGVSHSLDGMTFGVPPQMQGTHHNEFFSVSNQIGQNNNMIANQNGVAQPPHEANPGNSPHNQGSQHGSPFRGPNHLGQNNTAVAHHQMNPRAPSYIPGTHHNEPFHEPNHPGHGNVGPPQNGTIQPFPGMNPEHLPPHSSQPHPSAPHHPVPDGLNVPPHSEFNGVQQTNVGHPNPESNDMHPGIHHPNQGVLAGSFEGNQTGAVITHPHGPPQPYQQDAPVPNPGFVNPTIPGYQPDVHAWPNNSHAPAPVAQEPDRFSDPGTVHRNPSNARFTMPPSSNGMGTGVQAPNAMGQNTPPNANPPFPQDGQFNHPSNGGTQPANDQNIENMGNPNGFHAGSQGFPNGMAYHPVPAPQPSDSNAAQHMNQNNRSFQNGVHMHQNNHGFQNGVVHHPVPAPQPSDSNAAQHMNQNNRSFQNGVVHHPASAPQPSNSYAAQHMHQNNRDFQNGVVHNPVPQRSNSYAAQHMNQNNQGFQNGVIYDPASGAQPNGNSHAAHAGRPYTGQHANIEAGSNRVTHKAGEGEATGQYPALAPVPTVALNRQVYAQRFEQRPAQYHNLESRQIQNSQIGHGVGAPPQPYVIQAPIRRHTIPIDPCVRMWRLKRDNRGNSTRGVRRRAQPGQPRATRRSTGTTSNQPPSHSQSNGEGGLAPIPPGISQPTPEQGTQSGGAPRVQPISQPNGHPTVPTSAETPAGVHPAPQENGYPAPYANDNRENRENIYPAELQCGNGGVSPDPAVFQEPANPTRGQRIDWAPPSVPAASANGMETAPTQNGNPENAALGGLPDEAQFDTSVGSWFTEFYDPRCIDDQSDVGQRYAEQMDHANTPGDLGQIPASTRLSPTQLNAGQLTAEDFDESMQMIELIGHDNTPGYPVQLPSLAGSSSSAQPSNVGQPGQEEMEVDHGNTPGGPAQIPSPTGSSSAQPNASQFRAEDFEETMAMMRDDDDDDDGNPVQSSNDESCGSRNEQ
ncbi:hypothetical protein BDDG_04031 [Blastomyces dermatitidis ATCC 18188]|uniref:Uncharacterized protein n=1 Tax=Ajellomyces dermatitidis (strain ATCC 18188 / CBS 674.68) TaxID=653446 RepID=F2TCX9_AJEDA|nr:hypothetical protein BDDG_04031 [Blastomyces dermatitidis ATCC 18188]